MSTFEPSRAFCWSVEPVAVRIAPLDRDVKRAARLLDRALRVAAADDPRGSPRAGCGVRAGRVAALGVEQVLEADDLALVTGRVDVGEVVGNRVELILLRLHPG